MSECERPRGSTQDRVREAIERVGGYWRPLAAAARLLEELGELGEHHIASDHNYAELGGELADLWIITTAMADQFLARVPEPETHRPRETSSADQFPHLVVAAGRIARIVNFYDGPKNPRSLDGWMSLEQAVTRFHRALADIAHAQQVDLRQAIEEKLAAIPILDDGRFRRNHDASTASVLRRFAGVQTTTLCPYAKTARLWGAPEWSSRSFDGNADTIVPSLTSFAKATVPECLDAFIIPGPPFVAMAELAAWFRRLLVELSRRDPEQQAVMDARVDQTGWQFAFNGRRMFVAVFSPLYDREHPRHSADDTYVFLQPEASFGRKGIGSGHPRSARTKEEIRRQFAAAGRPYLADTKDARVEAPLYLLPRWDGDAEVRWWDPVD